MPRRGRAVVAAVRELAALVGPVDMPAVAVAALAGPAGMPAVEERRAAGGLGAAAVRQPVGPVARPASGGR